MSYYQLAMVAVALLGWLVPTPWSRLRRLWRVVRVICRRHDHQCHYWNWHASDVRSDWLLYLLEESAQRAATYRERMRGGYPGH